jgi:hypothetical protein
MNKIELYNILIKEGYFTRKELELICEMMAYDLETLNKAIYTRYGANNYNQLESWR